MKSQVEGKNGRALVKILSSDELSDLKKEYAELGIDSLLDSGILKEIPLCKFTQILQLPQNTKGGIARC
ncbi:hypothetical protein V9689_23930 [Klebsiella pneumoniae]|uniref:hypothetical protein n=1 Tax=Klebsiella pneumoniae TaxID=573 RepID=UPI00300FB45F